MKCLQTLLFGCLVMALVSAGSNGQTQDKPGNKADKNKADKNKADKKKADKKKADK